MNIASHLPSKCTISKIRHPYVHATEINKYGNYSHKYFIIYIFTQFVFISVLSPQLILNNEFSINDMNPPNHKDFPYSWEFILYILNIEYKIYFISYYWHLFKCTFMSIFPLFVFNYLI